MKIKLITTITLLSIASISQFANADPGIHGNWAAMYKIEHFKNEGNGTSSRPVHELVFGDGSLNFGDSGFGVGYVLKKVSFEVDPRDGSDNHANVRFTEMEIRPYYQFSSGQHWFKFETIYLGKTGYDKWSNSQSAYLIGGDGLGFRPYYKYQFNDQFAINTDFKYLKEDKNADGAGGGADGFYFYEAIVNPSYRITDNVTVGTEIFYKRGKDRRNDDNADSTAIERAIKPWIAYGFGDHRLFNKIEIQDNENRNNTTNKTTFESDSIKYIIGYNYPIMKNINFMAEYTYRNERNKVVNGKEADLDTDVNFGMIGLNYSF